MTDIEMQMSPGMIEEVMRDYERENPGKTANDMTTARRSDQTIQ